jgi:hypothetical protein
LTGTIAEPLKKLAELVGKGALVKAEAKRRRYYVSGMQ